MKCGILAYKFLYVIYRVISMLKRDRGLSLLIGGVRGHGS